MTCDIAGCTGDVTDRLARPDGSTMQCCSDCASELLTWPEWSYVEVIR